MTDAASDPGAGGADPAAADSRAEGALATPVVPAGGVIAGVVPGEPAAAPSGG